MRAMILAAGLGTRLRPLTLLRAKPALPVCGRPVINLLLALLERHGVREVLINLHYLPDTIRDAVLADPPKRLEITWSDEPEPLGTGGGIKRAADFLRASRECVVMAGDMLLDVDLTRLVELHRASGRDVTLLLKHDSRGADFGTIGIDANQRLTRIGKRPIQAESGNQESDNQMQAECSEGLFTGVRVFSRAALADWPAQDTFEDLRDWLAPRMTADGLRVGAEVFPETQIVWEPVGTLQEYHAVNMHPPHLPGLGGSAREWSGPLEPDLSPSTPNVLGEGAQVAANARIERCVVWEGESVPAGAQLADGIWAGGSFHSIDPNAQIEPGGMGR